MGKPAFPAGTILIRNTVQQHEMELHGKEMIDLFAGRSAQYKELLANATLRAPDITFEQEAQLDLGGVTARLLWFGGAHTKGDELTFVEPDRTLVSGDVVQNKVVPDIFRRRRDAFELARGPRQGRGAERAARAPGPQRSGRWFDGSA